MELTWNNKAYQYEPNASGLVQLPDKTVLRFISTMTFPPTTRAVEATGVLSGTPALARIVNESV